jgi:hypothetical protein
VIATYARGDHAGALGKVICAVSGVEWSSCEALLEQRIPGAVVQTISDAAVDIRVAVWSNVLVI